MKNKPATSNDNDSRIEQLQEQISELRVRTARIESRLSSETSPPTQPGQRHTQRTPRVGDIVTFRPTKITTGGTGRITRIVRNFVIIERPNGEIVQRAPRNVAVVTETSHHGK